MRLEQSAEYIDTDHWKWSVWVDAPAEEFAQIEAVEYVLHPTFPQPVQVVRTPETKFRLDASGWGEFEINAHAWLRDGSAEHMRHWLSLSSGEKRAPGKGGETPPKVYVSYAAADAKWGTAIQDALAERGVDAMTADDVGLGDAWQESIDSAIDEADLVVGIFSDATSLFVEREVSEAAAKNVEIVPIAVGDESHVPDWLQTRQIVSVSRESDVAAAVESLVDRTT